MNRILVFTTLTFAVSSVFICEESAAGTATRLEEVLVQANRDASASHRSLPEVQGSKIYSGKKTSLVDLAQAPTIVNNNYRQALQKMAGLLVVEESTPLINIGYRGLEPNRAQFTQVLMDGVPIHPDTLGYPEVFYTPPLQLVEHVDFVRSGGALMYGPQPGGALNYVTKDPSKSAFSLTQENSAGDNGFYSNYSDFSGTEGAVGYLAYFHHRQSQGFRDYNSQYEVYNGGLKLKIEQDPTLRWTLAFNLYNEEHREPGGLTRADFDNNSSQPTRLSDHFEVNRSAGSVTLEKDLSENSLLELRAYGTYYERLSWRQRGGGLGIVPTGAAASTNDIQSNEFYTGGVEARWRQDYEAFGSDEHVLSGGALYHHTDSPRIDKRGLSADARDGFVRKDSDRSVDYASVFLENLFKFGALSITPGARLENIWQNIAENTNLDKTTVPLADESTYDFVALAGVGAELELAKDFKAYGNFSQGYRPKIFAEAVPIGVNEIANQDLKEGRSWQADAGLKGTVARFFSWDAGYFYMEFDDQIGTVANSVQNVGDARHQGIELVFEMDAVKGWDEITRSHYADTVGRFNIFYNALFLDAEFTGGPHTGRIPQYAPDFIQKFGVEYGWKDRVKIRLAGSFLDDHFSDAVNDAVWAIPSYKVWDLTAEAKVYRDSVSVFGGVNNIFDEHYFSRVIERTGIDPADGRNIYGGVKIVW